MRKVKPKEKQGAYLLIVLGFLLGVFSFVRMGSIAISLGTAVIAITDWKRGRIARYLPLLISASLFLMAIALPSGL